MKKKLTAKNVIIYLVTLTLSIVLLFVGRYFATRHAVEQEPVVDGTCRARVLTTDVAPSRFYEETPSPEDAVATDFNFTAQITSGEHRGMEINAVQTMESYYASNRKYVEPGDKILVMPSYDMDGNEQWVWVEYIRTDALWIFLGVFCVGLVLFGAWKGFNTLISLVITVAAVFLVFLPAILAGENAYLWSILTCLYITLMTLLLVEGATKLSFVAGVGCFAGTLAAALLSLGMSRILHLTGVHNDESIYLMMLNTARPIDLRGVVFAGIIIGAVGAIMDVAMSITSPLFELYEQTGGMSAGQLIKSGIRIGRDFMSTMANTLVLAYIGCDLSLVMLLMAYNTSLLEMLNREMLISEMLQSIAGSFGILLTIPLASVICAMVLCRGNKRGYEAEDDGAPLPAPRPLKTISNSDLARPQQGDLRSMSSRPKRPLY